MDFPATERHESFQRLMGFAGECAGIRGPSALATALSESEQVVTNWARRGVSKGGAIKAQEVFGCTVNWVLSGTLPKTVSEKTAFAPSDFSDLIPTPVIVRYAYLHGVIQGGDSGFIDCVAVTDQDPEPIPYFANLRDEQAYAIKVRGSSMEPAIMPGWSVIASPNRPAQPPDLCVVYFADDRKALKRLLWQRGGITCLESIHKDHAKMMEPEGSILRMDKVISIVPN